MEVFMSKYILLGLFITNSAFAGEKTIPVILKANYQNTDKDVKNRMGAQASMSPNGDTMPRGNILTNREIIREIPTVQLSDFIKTTRDAICPVNKNGEYKFWIKTDADGKVFGIGLSSEAGFEVTVKCES